MAKKDFTIKDIAQQLNVSISTVSRALSNHPRIGLSTKEKVLALAQKLNFRPNPMAVNFKNSKSKNIGIIIPELTKHFYSQLITGAETAASEYGYNVIVCQSHESTYKEEKLIEVLLNSRVEGLLICITNETVDTERFTKIKNAGVPIVFCDRQMADLDITSVITDDYQGAFLATEYLINKGCKRIAHLAGPENIPNSQNREQGYKDAIKKHELNYQKIIYTHYLTPQVQVATRQLLLATPRPEAVLCYNDYVAFDAIEIIKEYDLEVGKDILVIGFADEPIAQYMTPKLTTVKQPVWEMGKIAMQLLLVELKGEILPQGSFSKKLETVLVLRDSA